MNRTTKKAALAADREARREAMSLRTTPTMKAALVAAASQSGRSLTQEIEFRLEASFSEDRMRRIIREELEATAQRPQHYNGPFTIHVSGRQQENAGEVMRRFALLGARAGELSGKLEEGGEAEGHDASPDPS